MKAKLPQNLSQNDLNSKKGQVTVLLRALYAFGDDANGTCDNIIRWRTSDKIWQDDAF